MKRKNLYLLTHHQPTDDCDVYDSVVVCATSATLAKKIHPSGDDSSWMDSSGWCASPKQVTAKLLGRANSRTPLGVVLASFNAG